MAIRRVRPSKALVRAGCGSVFQGGGGQEGAGSSTLNLNLTAEIPELDSAKTSDTVSFDVLTNVNEGLYRLDINNEPIPAVAEGVELSNGDLTYTFTLRDGVQWSNGDPVTSQDFKYAWLKVLNPETAATYAYIISTFVKGAEEYNLDKAGPEAVAIETPDDKTINLYEAGELDLTSLTGDRVKQYSNSPDFFRFPLPSTQYGRMKQKIAGLENI